MSLAEISAAAPPPALPHEVGEEIRAKVKRGLGVDLNVALSEEHGFSNSNEKGHEIDEEEISTAIVDSEEEMERRNRRWEALIDVGEIALRECEERGSGSTRKKRATRGVGELGSGSTRKKNIGERNDDVLQCGDDCVVSRSTIRGRAVAMPSKYRDSVLEQVAEFHRFNRTCKSVTTKRKTRLLRDDK